MQGTAGSETKAINVNAAATSKTTAYLTYLELPGFSIRLTHGPPDDAGLLRLLRSTVLLI